MILKMEGTNCYRDQPDEIKEKIVSLVFEEFERMNKYKRRISYEEIARIITEKTGVRVRRNTIWRWLNGENIPMGTKRHKVPRRAPDEDAQIVRGLSITDLNVIYQRYTIRLKVNTTKDFFAHRMQRFFSRYGWTMVKPVLDDNMTWWHLVAHLDTKSWIRELEKPVKELTNEERLKLLSGAISGDGCIAVTHTDRKHVWFAIKLYNGKRETIKTIHQVFKSLTIPYGFARLYDANEIHIIEGRIIKSTQHIIKSRRPMYVFTVTERNAVEYLLKNLRLLQPFREVKRILALRFIKKDKIDRDLVKPVWDWLRVIEKTSTIRSIIRACELIPDERFAERILDKQQILKELHRRLHEYADRVRELRQEATKIINMLRAASPPSLFP